MPVGPDAPVCREERPAPRGDPGADPDPDRAFPARGGTRRPRPGSARTHAGGAQDPYSPRRGRRLCRAAALSGSSGATRSTGLGGAGRGDSLGDGEGRGRDSRPRGVADAATGRRVVDDSGRDGLRALRCRPAHGRRVVYRPEPAGLRDRPYPRRGIRNSRAGGASLCARRAPHDWHISRRHRPAGARGSSRARGRRRHLAAIAGLVGG